MNDLYVYVVFLSGVLLSEDALQNLKKSIFISSKNFLLNNYIFILFYKNKISYDTYTCKLLIKNK